MQCYSTAPGHCPLCSRASQGHAESCRSELGPLTPNAGEKPTPHSRDPLRPLVGRESGADTPGQAERSESRNRPGLAAGGSDQAWQSQVDAPKRPRSSFKLLRSSAIVSFTNLVFRPSTMPLTLANAMLDDKSPTLPFWVFPCASGVGRPVARACCRSGFLPGQQGR